MWFPVLIKLYTGHYLSQRTDHAEICKHDSSTGYLVETRRIGTLNLPSGIWIRKLP